MPDVQSIGDILTIRQLAEYLMVSEKTVYRMLDRNQLPAIRLGSQWRFPEQAIDNRLAARVGPGGVGGGGGGGASARTPWLCGAHRPAQRRASGGLAR